MTQVVKLNDGNNMPAIGLGTSHPGVFSCDPVVIEALEVGYRHFDTAYLYANQEELGKALKKGLDQLKLKRSDVFITSKVWNTFHSKDLALKNCQTCLEMLQLDYLDCLLIHYPMGFKEGDNSVPLDENEKVLYSDVDYLETWKAMEECVKRGWTKSIGVSNFNIAQIERILANCTIKPAVYQGEGHPYYTQTELLDFLKKHKMVMTTYGPLGAPYVGGALGTKEVVDRNLHLLEDPVVLKIAENQKKTPAQVVLRWAIQRGTVPLPRSTKKHRLAENFGVFDFELTDAEIKQINDLNLNKRAYPFTQFCDHPHYPAL